MIRICSLLVVLATIYTGAAAQSGPVHVIDADTIDVGNIRVRLHGIDAPEIGQPCLSDGREWDCGSWARDETRKRFQGQHATCQEVDRDRYGRVVATCAVQGQDMGARLVSDGLAWAYRRYSDAYDLDEKAAAVAERGLWAFAMQEPADYRTTRIKGRDAPDPSCAIKGNISSNGQIYHMPGGRGYARTGINLAKGERWFCSPAEAEAAGWRAAR